MRRVLDRTPASRYTLAADMAAALEASTAWCKGTPLGRICPGSGAPRHSDRDTVLASAKRGTTFNPFLSSDARKLAFASRTQEGRAQLRVIANAEGSAAVTARIS